MRALKTVAEVARTESPVKVSAEATINFIRGLSKTAAKRTLLYECVLGGNSYLRQRYGNLHGNADLLSNSWVPHEKAARESDNGEFWCSRMDSPDDASYDNLHDNSSRTTGSAGSGGSEGSADKAGLRRNIATPSTTSSTRTMQKPEINRKDLPELASDSILSDSLSIAAKEPDKLTDNEDKSSRFRRRRFLNSSVLDNLEAGINSRNWPRGLLSDSMPSIEDIRGMMVFPRSRQATGLKLMAAGSLKPHPQKELTGGEDAIFMCEQSNAVGVADGVSEWKSFGVDPRLFAEELMRCCQYVAGTHSPATDGACISNRAQAILTEGFAKVRAFGGSTATIACVDSSGSSLEVSNLGDSTLAVLRRGIVMGKMEVTFRTVELQHCFNTPYQLIRLPDLTELEELREKGQTDLARVTLRVRMGKANKLDTPEDATTYRVPIREGDLIILGTDGLFDNLYEEEICEVASLALSPADAVSIGRPEDYTAPLKMARLFAEMAHFRSQDKNAVIPFILNAQKAGVIRRTEHRAGGKPDDIAVVVCWAVRGDE